MSGAPQTMPVVLLSWKAVVRGSLRGFATVKLGKSLIIHDVCVMASNGRLWASLPAKPQVGSDGMVLRTDTGKTKYTAVAEWTDRDAQSRFSLAVIEAIRREHGPEALEPTA